MFVEKLTDKQIEDFVAKSFISQTDDIEKIHFFKNEDLFIKNIRSDREEPLCNENMTYILFKKIIRDYNKGRIWVTGMSVKLVDGQDAKSAQLIKFCLEDFRLNFQSALLFENGDLRNNYVKFMYNLFGEEYKNMYNEYLKNKLEYELLK